MTKPSKAEPLGKVQKMDNSGDCGGQAVVRVTDFMYNLKEETGIVVLAL